jgi:hypothetical protein
MQKTRLTCLLSIFFLWIVFTTSFSYSVSAWSNGSYSTDSTHPAYGTHDWIAQHALDWLSTPERQFYSENLASYFYGTELPDNANALDGIGDTTRHHVYFFANGSLQDDAAAVRAKQEYANAQTCFAARNLTAAAEHLGMATHYISDLAVFGHVMGAATSWGAEKHHSDYEDYVLERTRTYSSEFNGYLAFDGNLTIKSAYAASVTIARDTTFDDSRGGYNCTWMDQHYNWNDPIFKNRCGESLNEATNAVADVLHTFYLETVTPSTGPTQTPVATVTPTSTPTNEPTSTTVLTASPTPALSPTTTLTQTLSPTPAIPELTHCTVVILTILATIVTIMVLKQRVNTT